MTGLPADQRLLTPRRLEVLRLAANGHSNPEIARLLWISEDSVKSHFRLAYEQLGARDRANAVAICLVRGLIHPHEIKLRPPGPYPWREPKCPPRKLPAGCVTGALDPPPKAVGPTPPPAPAQP